MSLGLGSVMAAMVSSAPFLITLSQHKIWLFVGAGLLLALNYWLVMVLPAKRHCKPGEMCHIGSRTSRANRVIFWSSVAVYLIAFGISYVLPPVLNALGVIG